MRTITTTLYQYSELNEQAKKHAIDCLRQQAYGCMADSDWDDANKTIQQVQDIAQVKCEICSSSQGHYVRWCKDISEEYDMTDSEQFEDFKRRFLEEFETNTWSDDMMHSLMQDAEFDDKRSYAGNISWLIAAFCNDVELDTIAYLEDDCVEEWICGQYFEFTEDGRLYQH